MRRRRAAVRADELAALISAPGGPPDVGTMVRTLARAVVHVPMPGQAEERSPRTVAGTQEGAPLYVVADDDGGHALLYTTPQRLVAAWGATTAASIPFATLLQAWPQGVDAVLDAGHAEEVVLPVEVLRDVALHVAGVPTAAALTPSPAGVLARRPDPAPQQLLDAAREAAETARQVRALSCAEVLDREPTSRPVLTVVDLDAVHDDRLSQVMGGLVERIVAAEPRPVRLVAVVEGHRSGSADLVDEVRSVVRPFWQGAPA